jgi:hypothetical protein
MKFAITGATAVAFAAVALATAAVASADSEEEFLTTLEVGGFSWADEAGRQALIDGGHGVCEELERGAPVVDMITEGAAATGWTATQFGFFIGAATSEFCPQHMQRAIEESEALGG